MKKRLSLLLVCLMLLIASGLQTCAFADQTDSAPASMLLTKKDLGALEGDTVWVSSSTDGQTLLGLNGNNLVLGKLQSGEISPVIIDFENSAEDTYGNFAAFANKLLRSVATSEDSATWSPDGRYIAIKSWTLGLQHARFEIDLYLIDTQSSTLRMLKTWPSKMGTSGMSVVYQVAFSQDSSLLYYSIYGNTSANRCSSYAYNIATGEETFAANNVMTDSHGTEAYADLPDLHVTSGGNLVQLSETIRAGERSLVITNPDSGRTITPLVYRDTQPFFLPHRLYYSRESGNAVILWRNSGSKYAISLFRPDEGPEGAERLLLLKPDGVISAAVSELYGVNGKLTDLGAEYLEVDSSIGYYFKIGACLNIHRAAMSPDGEYLLMLTGDNQTGYAFYALRLSTLEMIPVTLEGFNPETDLSAISGNLTAYKAGLLWSGENLIFVSTSTGTQAYEISLIEPEATEEPTPVPTEEPTPEPTEEPTPVPTEEPTPVPTEEPTPEPTEEPTPVPTEEPTPVPTEEPTPVPTKEPTPVPTEEPTPEPTEEPTPVPTEEPTPVPTEEPTPEPTEEPTPVPTEEPTPEPTEEPTPEPTEEPTPTPIPEPTAEPMSVEELGDFFGCWQVLEENGSKITCLHIQKNGAVIVESDSESYALRASWRAIGSAAIELYHPLTAETALMQQINADMVFISELGACVRAEKDPSIVPYIGRWESKQPNTASFISFREDMTATVGRIYMDLAAATTEMVCSIQDGSITLQPVTGSGESIELVYDPETDTFTSNSSEWNGLARFSEETVAETSVEPSPYAGVWHASYPLAGGTVSTQTLYLMEDGSALIISESIADASSREISSREVSFSEWTLKSSVLTADEITAVLDGDRLLMLGMLDASKQAIYFEKADTINAANAGVYHALYRQSSSDYCYLILYLPADGMGLADAVNLETGSHDPDLVLWKTENAMVSLYTPGAGDPEIVLMPVDGLLYDMTGIDPTGTAVTFEPLPDAEDMVGVWLFEDAGSAKVTLEADGTAIVEENGQVISACWKAEGGLVTVWSANHAVMTHAVFAGGQLIFVDGGTAAYGTLID